MSVSSDSDGMVVEELAELLKTQRIKGVYVVPNFGNPSGITLSAARRELLVKLAAEHNFLIIEDDPYGELRFTEERHPTLHQVSQRVLGNTDHIIYTSTFSKIPRRACGWAGRSCRRSCCIKWRSSSRRRICTPARCRRASSNATSARRLPAQIDKIRAAYKQKGEIPPVWWSRSWATTSPSISRRAACSCGHVSASRSTPPNG